MGTENQAVQQEEGARENSTVITELGGAALNVVPEPMPVALQTVQVGAESEPLIQTNLETEVVEVLTTETVEQGALFSRTLEDGTVVTAETFEEVIRICGPLAKINAENPQLAKSLAETSKQGVSAIEASRERTRLKKEHQANTKVKKEDTTTITPKNEEKPKPEAGKVLPATEKKFLPEPPTQIKAPLPLRALTMRESVQDQEIINVDQRKVSAVIVSKKELLPPPTVFKETVKADVKIHRLPPVPKKVLDTPSRVHDLLPLPLKRTRKPVQIILPAFILAKSAVPKGKPSEKQLSIGRPKIIKTDVIQDNRATVGPPVTEKITPLPLEIPIKIDKTTVVPKEVVIKPPFPELIVNDVPKPIQSASDVLVSEPALEVILPIKTDHISELPLEAEVSLLDKRDEAESIISDKEYDDDLSYFGEQGDDYISREEESVPFEDFLDEENDIGASEDLVAIFGEETIDIYNQLHALEQGEAVPATELNDSAELDDIATIQAETPIFQELVLIEQTSEVPVTIEIIHEQAQEQPLEQTFAQLAVVLGQDSETLKQNDKAQEIIAVLIEIEHILPYCSVTLETGEQKLQITPELVEKLLTLLAQLGYQQPGEALVNFMAQYDLSFLIKTLRYMVRLASEETNYEYLQSLLGVSLTTTKRSRLQKFLFALVAKMTFEPRLEIL